MQVWHLHGVLKGAEVPHLSTKHKVTQLRISQKDDEEHDGEATNIFGALQHKEREKSLLQSITIGNDCYWQPTAMNALRNPPSVTKIWSTCG